MSAAAAGATGGRPALGGVSLAGIMPMPWMREATRAAEQYERDVQRFGADNALRLQNLANSSGWSRADWVGLWDRSATVRGAVARCEDPQETLSLWLDLVEATHTFRLDVIDTMEAVGLLDPHARHQREAGPWPYADRGRPRRSAGLRISREQILEALSRHRRGTSTTGRADDDGTD